MDNILGIVISLIVVALGITVGAIVYNDTYSVLDAQRDSGFSEDANSTISTIDTNFWSGQDLMVVLLIVIPASALLFAIVTYMGGTGRL